MCMTVLILGSTELSTLCLCGQAADFCLLSFSSCVHALQLQAIAEAESHPSLIKVVHVLPLQLLCHSGPPHGAGPARHWAHHPRAPVHDALRGAGALPDSSPEVDCGRDAGGAPHNRCGRRDAPVECVPARRDQQAPRRRCRWAGTRRLALDFITHDNPVSAATVAELCELPCSAQGPTTALHPSQPIAAGRVLGVPFPGPTLLTNMPEH